MVLVCYGLTISSLSHKGNCDEMMASTLDGLGLEGSVLDGLAEWPASTTRKEWFAITRQSIQETIADMSQLPSQCASERDAS